MKQVHDVTVFQEAYSDLLHPAHLHCLCFESFWLIGTWLRQTLGRAELKSGEVTHFLSQNKWLHFIWLCSEMLHLYMQEVMEIMRSALKVARTTLNAMDHTCSFDNIPLIYRWHILLGLADTDNAFWWIVLNINRNFIDKIFFSQVLSVGRDIVRHFPFGFSHYKPCLYLTTWNHRDKSEFSCKTNISTSIPLLIHLQQKQHMSFWVSNWNGVETTAA